MNATFSKLCHDQIGTMNHSSQFMFWSRNMMTSSNGNIFRVTGLVWGIRRSPVNSPHKGQCRGVSMFSMICAWINGIVNNREVVDLRRHRTYYDVTVMNNVMRSVSSFVLIDLLGPIPETIHSRSAQIRSCDPDRPITFHKRLSRSAHEIEKIRNLTFYCQLNHDINHSLGNSELNLRGRDWMKNVRLMIYIHDVTMGCVVTSWPVQCTQTVFAHDTTRFGHAIFDRYVYVINVIENIQTVYTRQFMFQ